ncbi:MAG: phosphoribosyltransferase family protein [Gemmatimonadota bacterium]|nr:phosphoribosyltransferase family protein [Gemmatimonadota bacterium]
MSEKGFRVFDAADVERLLDRMAEEAAAALGEEIAVVGILRRGAPLSKRLADRLETAGTSVHRGEFELKRYSDQLDVIHERTRMEEPDLPFEVDGKTVLLVDDVLYTGRTLLRAAEWMVAEGAGRVACAVLCAREGRETPVDAEFVGAWLEVGAGGIVDVEIPPYEERVGVVVRHREPE